MNIKKIFTVMLTVVFLAGITSTTAMAQEEDSIGFNAVKHDYHENKLELEGYLYNVGNAPISDFSSVTLSIYDENEELIGNTTFEDSNFEGIILNPGESKPYTFAIEGLETDIDFDEDEWYYEYTFDYVEGDKINLGDGLKIYYSNQKVEFGEVQPRVTEGRTLVPVRFLTEKMGAEVDWNKDTKTAIIKKGDTTVEITLDSKIAKVNGEEVELDVPATSENGRTIVPLRFVLESFGCDIVWGKEQSIILIVDEKI